MTNEEAHSGIIEDPAAKPTNGLRSGSRIYGKSAENAYIDLSPANRPLGADGYEMPVLLPEFLGGAHACHPSHFKSDTRGVVAGGFRRPQSAARACPALPQSGTLASGCADRTHLFPRGRDGVACAAVARSHDRGRD